jgi:hypothetical protein
MRGCPMSGKYCTPAMLSALTELKKGTPCPAPLRETLRSRGWVNKDGTISQKGLVYLADKRYPNGSNF